MKVFIMAILMCHVDVTGSFYYTSMIEEPRIEYSTYEECVDAAKIKRRNMLKSSLKYPDLEIFDVIIKCENSIESQEDLI
ncbi:hypothetical protein EBU71_00395 [bacterium]|nr:hypothetical protein [Candidatus Elulimicrobium humile]